jgi:type IV pilus assembly protein PilO
MKNMTLNNIHEWPLMTRMLLLLLVFFAVLYLGYRFNLSRQIKDLTRAAAQEADLKQQIELVVRKNQVIQSEVVHLPELQAELSKWKKQLVDYNDLPELLNQILKLGGDNHLFFSSFTPGEPVKVDVKVAAKSEDAAASASAPVDPAAPPPEPIKVISFSKVPIKVVVVGNYHELADFISQVANLPWIVAVGNFTISNENTSTLLGDAMAKQATAQNLLSAELVLDVYNAPESK